ncbi:MAG TPA: hypothetical protein VE732_09185 [Nitrososphaera sp.]|jgi:hypothetical protein|nr:hypothetical protein [Nitrososphaera sp.]
MNESLIQAALAELEKTSLWKAYVEFQEIEVILADDVKVTGKAEKNENNRQFWRRTAVRAIFALIEGVVYRMKQLAYEVHVYEGMPLPNADAALLLEESYELNDKGVAITRYNYPQIEKNIKFAFASVTRAYNITYQLNLSDARWDAFKKTLKVRNRLTHPKHTQDLIVSDEEAATMLVAYIWFLSCLKELVGEIGTALAHRAQELEK